LKSVHKRFAAVLTALILAIGISAAGPATAGAATDVMIVFDTTGSMGGPLTEAKEEIQEAMAQISASLPDVQFGLAEVSDYDEVNNNGAFSYAIGEGHEPWTLHTGITPNQDLVTAALLELEAEGGGDGPEAYGRALYETDVNPSVGWRPGARGVMILVLDNLPHDNDLNEGIPADLQVGPTPYDTGIDPGRDNTVGTADDLDFQSTVLQQLKNDGRPIGVVDYRGGEKGFLPYWEYWAGLTGGSALDGESAFLGKEIVALTKATAEKAPLSDCPAGQVHDASENCVAAPTPPPPPPSNNFKYEPRISCSRGCRTVIVKITFDSDGNVIGESIPEEEKGTVFASFSAVGHQKGKSHGKGKGQKKNGCAAKKKKSGTHKARAKSSARRGKKGKKKKAKCKRPPLIRKFSQAVIAGSNTLKLKLTGAAIKKLNKKGKLNVGVKLTYTPNGGEAKVLTHTYKLVRPKKGKGKKGKKKSGHHKGGRGKGKSKR
jgi:hypothetical protein